MSAPLPPCICIQMSHWGKGCYQNDQSPVHRVRYICGPCGRSAIKMYKGHESGLFLIAVQPQVPIPIALEQLLTSQIGFCDSNLEVTDASWGKSFLLYSIARYGRRSVWEKVQIRVGSNAQVLQRA